MILEICIKGFVGLVFFFFLALKMGLRRRKMENHWANSVDNGTRSKPKSSPKYFELFRAVLVVITIFRN